MPEANFSLNSSNSKCTIDPTEINSIGGPENPKLQIWLALELNPGEGKQLQPFILLSVEAKLRTYNSSSDIASAVCLQNYSVNSKYTYRIKLEFVLTNYKLGKIEEKRIDNFIGTLDLTFRALNFDSFVVPVNNERKSIKTIKDIRNAYCNLNFEIPQSYWITKLLPGLGWNASRLIELPITNELIPEEYSQSLGELDKANEYYLKGDYDKVVAHCRSALDPIKASWKKLKPLFKSDSENEWIDAINTSTSNWLDTMINKTYQLCSKTHHNSTIGHFDQHSSQIVLMTTVAVVGFAGKCISENSSTK